VTVWACRICGGEYHFVAAMGGISRRCTSTGGERRAAYSTRPPLAPYSPLMRKRPRRGILCGLGRVDGQRVNFGARPRHKTDPAEWFS